MYSSSERVYSRKFQTFISPNNPSWSPSRTSLDALSPKRKPTSIVRNLLPPAHPPREMKPIAGLHARIRGSSRRTSEHVKCPISGQGKMTKPERERRAKEIIAESGADSEGLFKEVTAANLGVTFRQQAEWFLNRVKFRKRKPIKPATAKSWDNCLQKWLCPNLGHMPLASVNNPSVKLLVSQMADAGLSPKSIHNYVQIIKMVVASALNEEGEPIYLRKWNHEFIDLPEVKNQRTPTFMGDEITQIIAAAEGHFRVLYAFLAGTGLRVGEAAGIEVQDVSPDASTIRIRQSVWNGVKQAPKTPNAIREVDLCAV